MPASTVFAQEYSAESLDIVIVGAGFSGLYMLHRARQMGLRAVVFEAGADIGGTWYWNRYPGARCDVPSVEYSYSFSHDLEQEWNWSERFATQPEILRYINHVADRFGLRGDIRLNTRVVSAVFDPTAAHWRVTTADGGQVTAAFCVMATGNLSNSKTLDVPGVDSFAGLTLHTGSWPAEPQDLSGKRVGVIGTGSSGIQAIPHLAEQAGHLYVFQRTPSYSVPARNAPLDEQAAAIIKGDYASLRRKGRESFSGVVSGPTPTSSALAVSDEQRTAAFEQSWAAGGMTFTRTFNDTLVNEHSNAHAAEFVRSKIREIVQDPATAALLSPSHHIGARRLCTDTDYYATFNRPNVTLVDVKAAPIEEITPRGVRTAREEIALDVLVFATGFDAVTGALLAMDIHVENGRALRDLWADGPANYLGLMIAGLPNFFMVTGPGSPSVLSNMVQAIEHHVEWIADCIAYLRTHGHAKIEATIEAQSAWVAHVNDMADLTLLPRSASWYVGANIPGKPRVFMPYAGGVHRYQTRAREIVDADYEGFRFG